MGKGLAVLKNVVTLISCVFLFGMCCVNNFHMAGSPDFDNGTFLVNCALIFIASMGATFSFLDLTELTKID